MPHIREATEVRFYAPDELPADAAVLDAAGVERWRTLLNGIRDDPAWRAQYGPSDERTVAARVYAIYCECDSCRDWRARGRPPC